MALPEWAVIKEAVEFGKEKLQQLNDATDRGDLTELAEAGIARLNALLNALTGDHDDTDYPPKANSPADSDV